MSALTPAEDDAQRAVIALARFMRNAEAAGWDDLAARSRSVLSQAGWLLQQTRLAAPTTNPKEITP